ncbi:MAG TPA: helix-turn-helix domain-containing protein [Pseudonocardia sp.]
MTATAGPATSEGARAAMATLSGVLLERLDRYIDNQLAHIFERRPELAGNDVFVDTVSGICRDNITAFARILAGSTPTAEADSVRESASTSGEMMSKAGLSLPELLEVYRRGQALLLQDFLGEALGDLDPAAPVTEILQHCMLWWSGYVDETLTHTIEGFAKGYDRLRTQFQARRLRAVEAVLQGKLTDIAQATSELRYELRGSHLGLVITHSPNASRDDFESAVERFTDLAGRTLGARHTLVIPFSSTHKWAWLATTDTPDDRALTALRPAANDHDLRVSAGTPAPGLPGFVLTHRQAHYASLAVEHLPNGPALATYREVAALTLLKLDRERIRAFVHDQLGGLAAKDHRMAELRHTVAVFLAEGRNAPRAAEVLRTHKNTVHYRIARAEEIRRRPLVERALELELALRLVTDYGDWALTD